MCNIITLSKIMYYEHMCLIKCSILVWKMLEIVIFGARKLWQMISMASVYRSYKCMKIED